MEKYIKQAVDLIKQYEGLSLKVYLDVGGLPTIGYGHLIKLNENFPHEITLNEAESLLITDLMPFVKTLNSCLQVALGDNQKAALLCLMYNIGEGAFKSSTLLKKVNLQSPLNEIEIEFNKWIYVAKKPIQGLISRRKKEFKLFATS
ncbi:MAG: lysozyme [Alphaproteobacteria bacterium]|jgi:lysozyme|nr:lysozyme [Alphaproteobacteria bacterium]